MEWIIKIEGKEEITNMSIILGNQRILIKFDPMAELLIFIGQYKPHNKEWVNFCQEEYSMEIDAEAIQNVLIRTYEKLKVRLIAYKNITDGLSLIKSIEFLED